jgi:hypothetical protein
LRLPAFSIAYHPESPLSSHAAGCAALPAWAPDLNADGKLDLVVSNVTANSVFVLLGNGDASFQPNVDYGAGAGAAYDS